MTRGYLEISFSTSRGGRVVTAYAMRFNQKRNLECLGGGTGSKGKGAELVFLS